VGVSAFAFSFSIEFLQQFLPSRDSSLVDVLSNTMGAVIGAQTYRAWGGSAKTHLAEFRRNASPALCVGLLVGCSIVGLLVSGVLQYGTRLGNWDPEFPLLIGNEGTGDRPWQGRVLRMELSDTAASEELVRDFAAGSPHRLHGGSIAAINFAATAWSPDAAANVPSFVWVGREQTATSTSTGVQVDREGWLQSRQAPREIARRIHASNEFTLRLVCASDNADQRGPARILSYSIDTEQRNFTLGQEGPDLVFRLRTPNTGPNGTHMPLVVPGVFSGPEVRDILVTYRGAMLRVAIASTSQVRNLEFSPGAILASYYLDLHPQHFVYIALAYYGLLFLLQLGPLAWFTPDASRYFLIGLPWFLTFAGVLEATLALASRRPFDWANLGMSLAVGATALVVVRVMKLGECSSLQGSPRGWPRTG
jgi:hypothetical protein